MPLNKETETVLDRNNRYPISRCNKTLEQLHKKSKYKHTIYAIHLSPGIK